MESPFWAQDPRFARRTTYPGGYPTAFSADTGQTQTTHDAIVALQARVKAYVPKPQFKHEPYMKVCCEQALEAALQGNFSIGCCIVDMQGTLTGTPGKIVAKGHNQLMYPRFCSSCHGEMVTLDKFEKMLADGTFGKKYTSADALPAGITLFTQLESCQMCLARIANSGVAACYYGAPDDGGGAVHLMCQLPPTYISLLNRQLHALADVSDDMVQLAFDCFFVNLGEVADKLNRRTGATPPNFGYCLPMFDPRVREASKKDIGGFVREPGWGPYCGPPR